ncbi:MAG: type II 3-dehydroquinate dehydratase [Flavobacteriales bacterium Tduv]
MNKICIINGPSLNLLGRREPDLYGLDSFEGYLDRLRHREYLTAIELIYHQSNHEGELIDVLHTVGFDLDGIVLNAGAYTHTSLAIADAIKSIPAPVVEVHITNVYARESFRHHSYIAPVCKGSICGFGLRSYELALLSLLDHIGCVPK